MATPLEEATAAARELATMAATVGVGAAPIPMALKRGHTCDATNQEECSAVVAAITPILASSAGVSTCATTLLTKLKAYFDTLYEPLT